MVKLQRLKRKSAFRQKRKRLKLRKTLKGNSDRHREITQFENEALAQGFTYIAGVDEVGRGPLAGPVVAAACLLPHDFFLPQLNDSKKLSEVKREEIFSLLTSNSQIHYGLGMVHHDVIDEINILQASFLAMQQAVEALSVAPDFILVDGHLLPSFLVPAKAIIKGDLRSHSIMAASILAKVTRDRYMAKLDLTWPQYQFASHKGYPTQAHLKALKQHGPSPCHRRSFAPVKELVMNTLLTPTPS
ncbi:MAG: ribonuclease HII [Candidatus Rhabdochlamydia sp.]